MGKSEIINQIRLSLIHLNIYKVLIFGSWAKETQVEGSDIDLLVVTNDDFFPESFAQKMEIKLKIANSLNSIRKFSDIDLIVHTRPMFEKFVELNSNFSREILSTGQVIYEGNNR